MPGENIHDWSTTAANNDTADTLINWREGMARAAVNDSARSVMAAVAKERNLWNGSAVTGGSVNAQTFTSGYSFASIATIPAGLRVLLKIGIGPKNTGTTTLNMDGLGAIEVKDQAGNALLGGELLLNNYAEFRYDGTNWILLYRPGGGGGDGGGGVLKYVSATALSYLPFKGSSIKIGGTTYEIPTTGVVGLTNTGAFVNGVSGVSLAANTTYFVYAFINASAVTADFATGGHSTSATTGNVGVEIKTGDDSRSLIGIIRTNASGQFADTATQRLVRSWFNHGGVFGQSVGTSNYTQSTVFAELGFEMRVMLVCWETDVLAVDISTVGAIQGPTLCQELMSAGVDGAAVGVSCYHMFYSFALGDTFGISTRLRVSEGYHYILPMFATADAATTVYAQNTVTTVGIVG